MKQVLNTLLPAWPSNSFFIKEFALTTAMVKQINNNMQKHKQFVDNPLDTQ